MHSLPFFGIINHIQIPSSILSIYEYLQTLETFRSLSIAIDNPFKRPSANPVNYVFTISRSTISNVTTTVNYQIVNVSNTLASDFVGGVFPSGNLVFAPGENTKTVTATIIGGAASGKTFAFELVNASDSDGGMIVVGDRITLNYGELPLALNAVLWLDASDATTISATNNLISEWRDKSGLNRHASNTQAATQPAYALNSLNGLNTITLSLDEMSIPNMLLTGTGWDVFAVASMVAGAQQWARLVSMRQQGTSADFNNGGSWFPIGRLSFNNSIHSQHISGTPGVDITLGAVYIMQASLTNTSLNLYFDGVLRATKSGVGSLNTTEGMRIGRSFNNVDNMPERWSGTLAEIVITPQLSTADRQQMEGYLANKWGLTASLPAGHPYKP